MALYPVSGCKIFIGGVVQEKSVDWVAGDFTSQTWVEISKWTQMGQIGDSAQLITSDIIAEGRTKKAKGTRNAGSMQNVFNVDALDPGQIAFLAGEKTDDNYAFKIELNDAPVVGPAPFASIRYFIGLIMQAQETGGGANTVQAMNGLVEINSNIVKVPAGPGT